MAEHTKLMKKYRPFGPGDGGFAGWHIYEDDSVQCPVAVLLEPHGGQKNKAGQSLYQTANAKKIVARWNACVDIPKPEAIPGMVELIKCIVAYDGIHFEHIIRQFRRRGSAALKEAGIVE